MLSLRIILWSIEDYLWNIRCLYAFYLHGPYGLSKVIEKIPFRFLIKYLRKYGASIGENCRFERGLNLHRPAMQGLPYCNLHIGNNVYLGHNTLIDLSQKVDIDDFVIIASRCQFWTHASYYDGSEAPAAPRYGEHFGEIRVGEYALIFSGVIITHGVTIGKHARIGAGAVVNSSIPDSVFAAGLPARIIK